MNNEYSQLNQFATPCVCMASDKIIDAPKFRNAIGMVVALVHFLNDIAMFSSTFRYCLKEDIYMESNTEKN